MTEADGVVADMAGVQQVSQIPQSSLPEGNETGLTPGVLLDAEGGGGTHRVRLLGLDDGERVAEVAPPPDEIGPVDEFGQAGHR